MSRLPGTLVRRLDRAARRAHRHHRFAHHPLCGAYRGERVRFGRYQLCRGCAAATLGLVSGVTAGALVPGLPIGALSALAIAGGGVGVLALARRLPIGGKLVSRALPASAAGFVAASGLTRADAIGLAMTLATVLTMALGIALYKHRGPCRDACAACPERTLTPCSGFRFAWRRERAFRRLAGRWIQDANYRSSGDLATARTSR
jgi:hypothetical protein